MFVAEMPQEIAETSTFSVASILARIPAVRVTVFGDFCLDAYWWLDDDDQEKSIETGLVLRHVRRQQYSLGGAGNVVANLVDLGVKHIKAVGAIGIDLFGGEVLRLLEERQVDTTELVIQGEGWQTMVYAKPFRSDEEQNRLDFGSGNIISSDVIESLTRALKRAVAESDVVIFNQQLPDGISTPELILRINKVISHYPDTPFIVDARHRASLYEGAIFKLNAIEAGRMLGEFSDSELVPVDQAQSYAQRLSGRTGQPVFLTRGEHGILVADGDEVHTIPGIQVIERTDSVGAGDTVVAALAAAVGAGGDPVQAARFANIAASVTVRKLHTTGTASPDEIRAVGDCPDYVYLPELADDARQAVCFADSEIELVSPLPEQLQIQHAIFDHDGTISTLREGWERIMEPIMMHAILGSQYSSVDAGLFQKVRNAVQHFIDKTTGVQTLVQMQGLVGMVRQFGFVPPEEILDEHGYKRIYSDALLEMVQKRVGKLERGELSATDFQVKNARAMLDHLHQRGVKLYLASGTDEADVRAEAEALGYAHLFGGRVFGAVGDVRVEAKKIVLERIIRAHNLAGHEFVTFGDGPVEIRETRKRGGICVGVGSDEMRRFGLNQSKRARLIRAGAHLVVPDFSQLSVLVGLLNLR